MLERLALGEHPAERVGGVARQIEKVVDGGGAVGCEFASIFMALGAEVVLIDSGPRLLPFMDGEISALLAATFLVAAVLAAHSYWNDLHETTVLTRLGVQAFAATVAVLGARLTLNPAGLSLGLLALPITVLALVWMTNLYNFMDGIDGFAGGMTVVGFTALAGFSFRGGQPMVGWVSLLVVGATAGFLVHNFPPARIFLGDVGSVPLGFLAGSLSLMGVRDGLFDPWVPVLLFSPFVVDATLTLVRRILRRERVWRPHREHYYQRLVLAGSLDLGQSRPVFGPQIVGLLFLHALRTGRLADLAAQILLPDTAT